MSDEKNLLSFLKILKFFTDKNIDFISKGISENNIEYFNNSYKFEMSQIQDMINSFDFVCDNEDISNV